MDMQKALNELYIKKNYIKAKSPYPANSQEGIELGNRIEVIIDRAAQNISTIYCLGYQLDPGLTPAPEMKNTPAMHTYESMEMHIERCQKAVKDAKAFVESRKIKK